MSRLNIRLRGALLLSGVILLATVTAGAATPPAVSGAATTPSPSPSVTPPLRVLSRAGSLTLLTDPEQSKVLFASGAAPFSLAPAGLSLTDDAFRFAFPVRTASLNPVSLAATISARGGFEFWGRQTMSAWTVLSFTRLSASLGTPATVSAVFDANQGRHTIMALDLSKQKVSPFTQGGHRWVRIAGIQATMSAWLVGQLKAAFPTYQPLSHALGTVTVTLRIG
jgi:hypothetical protein